MKKVTTLTASVVLFAFGLISSAVAANISKTFEIGPGTQNPSSNVRTFPVPCGRQVAAVVKFKRQGPASTLNDIPIKIEFREPDTAANQEGPIIKTLDGTAQTTEQSVTILSSGGGSLRGCTLPWRVRVKHTNPGSPPYMVFGTIRLDYDGGVVTIPYSENPSLNKNTSKTINIGTIAGLQQGRMEVTSDWIHIVFHVKAPGDVLLRFQLIDPNGATVQTAEGYSNGSLSSSPKLRLVHQLPSCVPGQWKLKITNNTNDDAAIDHMNLKLTPGCP